MDGSRQSENIRDRWRRWLQTLSFFAVVVILAVVFFLSATVQHNESVRREATAVAQEQTGVVQTRRWPTKHAFQETGMAGETMARATWTVEALYAQETARPARETADAIAVREQQTLGAEIQAARQSTPVAAAADVISPESAGRVQQLARWGQGALIAVLWSPDGRLLAVGTNLGVDLYGRESDSSVPLALVRHLDTQNPVSCLSFSPDGTELAVGLGFEGSQVWAVSTGALDRTVDSSRRYVDQLRFAPDGTLAFLAINDAEAPPKAYASLESGGSIFTPLSPFSLGNPALSSDGTLLAYGQDGGTITIWRSGEIEKSLSAAERSVWLVFSPDGTVLAHFSYAGTLQLWSVVDGTLLATLESTTKRMATGLAFSADGKALASWEEGVLRLWSVPDGQLKATVDIGHERTDGWGIQALALDPGGRVVTLADNDAGQVSFWQVSGLAVAQGENDRPGATPTGGAAAPMTEGPASISSVLSPVSQPALRGYLNPMMQLAFTPDSRRLLTVELGGRAWLWDLATGAPRAVLSCPGSSASGPLMAGAALADDGSTILTTCPDGKAVVWDTAGEQVVSTMGGGPSYTQPYPPALSPGGTYLATAAEKKVVLWSLHDGSLAYSFDVPSDAVDLTFSPDGSLFAAGLESGQLYLWRVAGGELLGAVDTGLPWVLSSVALSPDGKVVAVAGGNAAVYRIEDRQLAYTLGLERALAVAFSPDGRLLVVAESDGTVSFRRAEDGQVVATLPGSTTAVQDIVFSSDGRLMAISSYYGAVTVWGVR